MKKNILITGSKGSLGSYLCDEFLKNHYKIISVSRKLLKKKYKSKKEIENFYCDLSDYKSCLSMFKKLKKKFSKIDILILCNGKSAFSSDFSSNWKEALNSNFLASINCVESYQKIFNSKTLIIAISSIAGIKNINAPIEYSVAKSSLNYYCKIKAKELAKRKIRLNIISPGNIYQKGNLWDLKLKKNKNKTINYIKNVSPINMFCNPESIYQIIEYLNLEKNSFITGSNFVLDGGQTL